MLNYFINTKSFDNFLIYFSFFNMALITLIQIVKGKYNEQNNPNNTDTKKCVRYIESFWSLIFSILLIIIPYKLSHKPLVSMIIILFIIKLFIETVRTDFFNSDLDNKYKCVLCSYILIIFFISDTYSIYKDSFGYLSHLGKEILLIIYIVLKIITYIYFVILNGSIFLSLLNTSKLFRSFSKLVFVVSKYAKVIIQFINKARNKIVLNTTSFKKSIIYFLFFPIYLIFIFILNILIKIFFHLINIITTVIDWLMKYVKKSRYVIWMIIKIALICSLVTTYFIIINEPIFSDKVINVYNFLSTVILIPLLLSSFDRKTKKD